MRQSAWRRVITWNWAHCDRAPVVQLLKLNAYDISFILQWLISFIVQFPLKSVHLMNSHCYLTSFGAHVNQSAKCIVVFVKHTCQLPDSFDLIFFFSFWIKFMTKRLSLSASLYFSAQEGFRQTFIFAHWNGFDVGTTSIIIYIHLFVRSCAWH